MARTCCKPSPSLDNVYKLVLQDEAQRGLHNTSTTNEEAVAMYSHNRNNSSQRQAYVRGQSSSYKPMFCDHCKARNHNIDKCWKLHGYPTAAAPGVSFFNHCKVAGHVIVKCWKVHGYPTGHKLAAISFSQEQMNQLLALLPQTTNQSSNDGSHNAFLAEKIADHSNATVAEEFYHRYKGDVKLIKDLGLDAFRFSISWPRILPHGKVAKGVNPLGIQFYNNLINELLAYGITPYVTLFHWDLPQALEDEYGGFRSSKIVDDFRDYVELCFQEFGDRVKHWITVNEPNLFSDFGYADGSYAPGRCSSYIGNCTVGNSATEPYLVTHNMLLSHASAFKLYKDNYQEYQKGEIGIAISTNWIVPLDQSSANTKAASRAFDFLNGWVLDPINIGDYPETMRSLVGNRLPKFTEEQASMLKHSFDFIGLNYYTSFYGEDDNSTVSPYELSYTTDSRSKQTYYKDGVPIGEPTGCSWLHEYPQGLQYILSYVKEKYNNPPVIITENGMCDWNNYSLPIEEALQDYSRIRYHHDHLSFLNEEIRNGTDVKGYFIWSLLDDFEWPSGYTVRFGVYYINYKDRLTRYPKRSAFWFKKFLQKQVGPEILGFLAS